MVSSCILFKIKQILLHNRDKILKSCYAAIREETMEGPIEVLLHGREYKQLLESRAAVFREQYGLRKIDVEILYYLHRFGGSNTSKELRQAYKLTKGHISQSAEHLAGLGLLAFVPDEKDRRSVHFVLTAQAEEIVRSIEKMWEDMTAVVFDGITQEERRVLYEVAVKMTQNMECASDLRRNQRRQMRMNYEEKMTGYAERQKEICQKNDTISDQLYQDYGVYRGLRDQNGKGVLTGLTNISRIESFEMKDGVKTSCDGRLWYRGYPIESLVQELDEDSFGFEATAYLLLFGEKPNHQELLEFKKVLAEACHLPTNFTRDVIMKAPSSDIMNSMTRSILTLASYDNRATDTELGNSLRQCIQLISTFPMLAVYGYHAYNHYEQNDSMYIHRPDHDLSTAENILLMLRADRQYTKLEAKVLDTALMLHMEHGGGNNSTFTTRVVTSSGTDTYSAIAAAMSSLKGPKHGGANIKVMEMMEDIRTNVRDFEDKDEIEHYLAKLLAGEAFDGKGLIYGMGHAVYSLSDPRERIFKKFVEMLAVEKHRQVDMALYNNIEEIAPKLIAKQRKIFKGVSPNVDFYSGFVYQMLGIPVELYTPIFAIARIVGWSAHRIEEQICMGKIIRPAYMSVMEVKEQTEK